VSVISDADNFIGDLVRGIGVFTLYAGLVSGMYLTLTAIRAMDYKNITLYALDYSTVLLNLINIDLGNQQDPLPKS